MYSIYQPYLCEEPSLATIQCTYVSFRAPQIFFFPLFSKIWYGSELLICDPISAYKRTFPNFNVWGNIYTWKYYVSLLLTRCPHLSFATLMKALSLPFPSFPTPFPCSLSLLFPFPSLSPSPFQPLVFPLTSSLTTSTSSPPLFPYASSPSPATRFPRFF